MQCKTRPATKHGITYFRCMTHWGWMLKLPFQAFSEMSKKWWYAGLPYLAVLVRDIFCKFSGNSLCNSSEVRSHVGLNVLAKQCRCQESDQDSGINLGFISVEKSTVTMIVFLWLTGHIYCWLRPVFSEFIFKIFSSNQYTYLQTMHWKSNHHSSSLPSTGLSPTGLISNNALNMQSTQIYDDS